MEKLCDSEMRRIQQYEVHVTLDPDTEHIPRLILSDDGKQVSYGGNVWKNLPNNKVRFSESSCILGKQGFSSGRFYFEVQVGGTTWKVGVARESIDRTGSIYPCPDDGFWTVGMLNGNMYLPVVNDVVLTLRTKVQTVGVFVDYEEGLVSFYDVEARVKLRSFTGCSFTERLYPFFCLFCNRSGLIISPVNHSDMWYEG